MKKSLSLLVAAAMTLSTASVAFAADGATTTELSTQAKFDALKAAGVFSGFPDGTAGLDKEMTRAEFAKVLTKLSELAENSAANVYSDVAKTHWAAGFIGAASEAGLLNGLGGGKFGPSGKVTIEQIAKVADLVAGVEPSDKEVTGKVSAWAKGFVAAAIEAGLLPELPSYQVNATRGQLVDVAYDLASDLDDSVLQLAKAAQSGNREITVNFNRAVTDTEKKDLTFDVKNGLVGYTVTSKWADDNKSVVLSAVYLPAGDYTLTVKGFDAVTVKVADEVATKLEIGALTLQKADNQKLSVKLLNQFGKEIASPVLNINVYNATQSKAITPDADGNYDLKDDAAAKVDDNIVVTVVHNSSALSVTKSFKVVAGSSATVVKLGTVAPLKDKTRISVDQDGLVVPYELADQYGNKILLPETAKTAVGATKSFVVGGITFLVSDEAVVKEYAVDANGVLTINTGSKAGTVVLSALNVGTGATGSTTIKVEANAAVKTFQLNNPGVLVVAGEEIKVPFAAADTFGAAVAGKDVKLGTAAGQVNLTSNLAFAAGYPKINGKGELLFKFATNGTAYIYAYVDAVQVGNLALTVKEASQAVKVNGVKDVLSNIVNGVTVDFDTDNVTYLDTYNRTNNVGKLLKTDVTVTGTSATLVTATVGGEEVVTGIKADGTVTGNTTFKIKYHGTTAPVDNPAYEFTVNVVKAADVKSYTIDTIGTIYGSDKNTDGKHDVTVALVGKLASGAAVAIDSPASYDFVTTSDPSVISVTGDVIRGLKAGKATITAYNGSTKLAEQEVTVSDAAPVASKIEFGKDEYATTVAGTVTVVVTVKDQYGIAMTGVVGLLASGDADVATSADLVVTGKALGTATLTYITSNGVSATVPVVVN